MDGVEEIHWTRYLFSSRDHWRRDIVAYSIQSTAGGWAGSVRCWSSGNDRVNERITYFLVNRSGEELLEEDLLVLNTVVNGER